MKLLEAAFLALLSLVVCAPKLCVVVLLFLSKIWISCIIDCDYNFLSSICSIVK